MDATRLLPDDVIEAIVLGEPVGPAHGSLAAFARVVRDVGDGPVPRASDELAELLAHGLDPSASVSAPTPADPPRSAPGPAPRRLTAVAARVAGLGIVAKVALGSSLAAAGVGAAGAAGVLPAAANETVRDVIESVSPLEFVDRGGGGGATTTSTPPGTGRDEPTVDDDVTGADHRPGSGVVDESPGRSGETGPARADETPAASHGPDSTPAATTPAATAPSTVPSLGPPDEPGQGQAPGSDPSTVPAARENRAEGHVPGA
jgi:hypothetical protein